MDSFTNNVFDGRIVSCHSQRRQLIYDPSRIWTRYPISSIVFIKLSIRFVLDHWALTLVLGLRVMSTAVTLYGIADLVPCNYGALALASIPASWLTSLLYYSSSKVECLMKSNQRQWFGVFDDTFLESRPDNSLLPWTLCP